VKREDKELNIPHYAIPTASRVKKCVNGDQIDVYIYKNIYIYFFFFFSYTYIFINYILIL